jgi:hypothetical protein
MVISKNHLIVIYQYGKVGSSTLAGSICQTYSRGGKHYTQIQNEYDREIVCFVHDKNIFLDIISKNKFQPIFIITICRNLITRTISDFFEKINEITRIKDNDELIETFNTNKTEFIKLHFKLNYKYLDNFFEIFDEKFGFNIYESFDINEKYKLFEKNYVKLLFLRFEDIKLWPDIFRKIGIDLNWKNFNLSSDKPTFPIQQYFYNEFKLSKSEYLKYLETRHHHNFYTNEETAQILQKMIVFP